MTLKSGWQKITLADACNLRGGAAFKPALQGRASGDYPFIKVRDFNSDENLIRIHGADHWVDEADVSSIQGKPFPTGTSVFAKIGEALKHNRVRLLTRNTFIDNNLMAAVPRVGVVEPLFLFQLLRTFDFAALNAGTAVPYLTAGNLGRTEVLLPPLDLQGRIASILGAYDDLVEVNRRRIGLLEEQARRLFEEWFIRFRFPGHDGHKMVDAADGPLPQGWRQGVLGDLVEQRRDTTSAGEHLSGRAYLPIECIGRRTLAIFETRPWNEAQSSLQLFERDDILFGAMRAYFHKVAPAPMPGVTRSTCFVLRPRAPTLFAFATFALFRDDTVAFAAANSKGSTIPYAVWAGSLERLPISIPGRDLLQKFDDLVRPSIYLIMKLTEINKRLSASRDLLLPRLLSGELSLVAAERELKAAA